MAKFRLRVVAKTNDAAEAEAQLDALTSLPKYIVVKKPGPEVIEFRVCELAPANFDLVAGQIIEVDAPHNQDVADQAAAVLERENIPDGLILEETVTGNVKIYSDDGDFVHNMIADADAKRAREGWPTHTSGSIKPGISAFQDSAKGHPDAAAQGFGREIG